MRESESGAGENLKLGVFPGLPAAVFPGSTRREQLVPAHGGVTLRQDVILP